MSKFLNYFALAVVMGQVITPVLFGLIIWLSDLLIPGRNRDAHAMFAILTMLGISLTLLVLTIYFIRVKHWSRWLWMSWFWGSMSTAVTCFFYGCALYD